MTFPLNSHALAHHIAVLGKTGSGKTSTSKLIIEHVVPQGARVCILDPIKSDWWGLISSADGKHAGLPFQILGGPHGHVPLHDGAGHAIAELVATGALPLSIIDMADFKAGGANRFFNAFAESLMRNMRGVLYLVVEEAHEFAPKERSGVGDENMAVYYAKKLATAGRSKGIRLIVCSQRVQALHNAVLGSCETLIVHKFTAPADQAPVLTWLKSNVGDKEERTRIEQSLRTLKVGQGWVCGDQPLELHQFSRITTFDNSKTPDGSEVAAAVVTAKVDVTALRSIVGEAVQEAEANDPKTLKARIAELEREQRKPSLAVDVESLRREHAEGFTEGYRLAKREQWGEIRHDLVNRLDNLRGQIIGLIDDERESLRFERDSGDGFIAPPLPNSLERLKKIVVEKPGPSPSQWEEVDIHLLEKSDLPPVQQRILNALAELQQLGSAEPDRELVAFMAGYSHVNSKGFANAIGALNTAKLTQSGSGTVTLTPEGRRQARPPARPRTPEELQERIITMLGGASGRVLKPLIKAYPKSMARQALAEAAEYGHVNSKGFANAIGRLRGLGFIDYPDRGTVIAKPVLFLEGR